MTGDRLGAVRAAQLGLVSRLVEPGQARAEAVTVAERIGANAPVAVREARQITLAAFDQTERRALGLSPRLRRPGSSPRRTRRRAPGPSPRSDPLAGWGAEGPGGADRGHDGLSRAPVLGALGRAI